ncbi:MAG: hypothetical protein LQ338_003184 [Usnochroma carphineum]|nr:MAG: hypothetical protein LQ338_003184 [Usnochroma carphineum]
MQEASDTAARKAAVDAYVQKYTYDCMVPANPVKHPQTTAHCVVVTGATGSLGSHLVAHLTALPSVTRVICLNRTTRESEPEARQHKAFRDRGIHIDTRGLSKLRVLEVDTSQSRLGLSSDDYSGLVNSITHIVHNAWPMSGNRPIHPFKAQFQVIRNLIDLCYEAIAATSRIISFQFISSIAVVGHQPLWSGNPLVPEERVSIESVLPNGYGDAKYACERILDATLGQHARHFRAMSVRLGQVAGSSKTGYWNTQEHLSFLVKSSQTLRALPDFHNQLSWTPVDLVAATLSDLLFQSNGPPNPIYHIDNPVRQPWRSMITVWAAALDIPQSNIIPFDEWVCRVRHFPGSVEKDNPAYKLVEFLESNFLRMSCGGLLLDTTRSKAHSSTLATVGPVSDEVALGYIQYWKKVGFLSA